MARRYGQSNPMATAPDAVVAEVQRLRATFLTGYGSLARMFGVPKSTVQAWCNGSRRASAPKRAA